MAHYKVQTNKGLVEFDSPHADLNQMEVTAIVNKNQATGDNPLQSSYFGDVINNAKKEVPAMAQGLGQAASSVLGAVDPMTYARSGIQALQGTPLTETQSGQDIQGALGVVKSLPSALFGTVKTAGKTLAAPAQNMMGTPYAETMIGKQFRERPVGTGIDIAAIVAPFMRGAKVAPLAEAGAEVPNLLERTGIRGMNATIGLDPSTIEDMTPRGQNPGKFGIQLGKEMAEEGASGRSATGAFDNTQELANSYGKAVPAAIENIKANNPYQWEARYNLLHKKANSVLRPILEKAAKLEGSKYPEDAVAGKWYRAAYDSLAEKANANNGYLTFDHLRDELSHIGEVIGRSSEANLPLVKKVYRELIGISNGMVENVAKSAGKPELAKALRDANKGYHRYMSVLPDIRRAASRESVGKPSLSFHQAVLKKIEPAISESIYKLGKKLRRK